MGGEALAGAADSKICGPLVTPNNNALDRIALVRCLIEGLKDLGYPTSAKALEEESHVVPQPVAFVKLQEAVLKSDWKMAEELVCSSTESFAPPLQLEIRILMGEQRYLEAVEAGDIGQALVVLREHLSPIHKDTQRLALLASMLMLTNLDTFRKEAKWAGGEASRMQLMKAVQRLLPSAVPESRLLGLMDQALAHQVSKCGTHLPPVSFNILKDHACEQNPLDQCVAVLTDHTDEVTYVVFSPDFAQLASTGKDKSIIIWDMVSGDNRVVRTIPSDIAVFMLDWSPTGGLLLGASEFKVAIWEIETGEKRFEVDVEDVTGCCWLPQSNGIVTAAGNGRVVIWDLEGTVVHEWEEDEAARDVKIGGGRNLVVATEQKLVSYDLTTKAETARVELVDVTIMSLALSLDGLCAVVACTDNTIHTLDLLVVDLTRLVVTSKLSGPTQSMYVIRCSFGGANSSFVFSGSEDSRVYVWQRSSGSLLRTLDGHSAPVNQVAWSPHLLASCSDDRSIRLWGKATGGKERKND